MITEEQCMQDMLRVYPHFPEMREKYFGWKEEESPGFTFDMIVFSHYAQELIMHNESKKEIENIFSFIERLMCEGTQDVQNAAATGFLESLVNAIGRKEISAASFVPYLGKESKEYCQAWDVFFGGPKTPGLWDDDKSTTSK